MNISQIRYFTEIARFHSLSKAAEELYVSPSALSISIGKLEKELNTKLFERNSIGMFLTDQGKLILEDAQEILTILQSWDYKLHPIKTELSGTIKILSCPSITQTILVDFVQSLKSTAPNLDIEIEDTHFNVKNFIESKASLAFVMYSESDPLYTDIIKEMAIYGYTYDILFQEDLCIYMNKLNPLAKQPSVSLKQLKDNIFVTLHSKDLDIIQRKYLSFFPKRQTINFPNRNTIFAFIRNNNNAFTILASSTVSTSPTYLDPNIITKPLEDDAITQNIILFYPNDRTITSLEEKIVEALKERI